MTVGLVIITHEGIGEELLNTATGMLGVCPLNSRALRVSADQDPEVMLEAARALARKVDQGDGVLVLTDVFGSTPSNIASRLADSDRVRVVAGVNLPMLIRVLNYPRLTLPELVHKALSGGRDGILLCSPEEER